MNSKVWGQFLWRLLHTITYSYPNNCSSNLKTKYIEIFYCLRDIIPCVICRNHYKQRLTKMPVENYMGNKDAFINWLINLHNEVNVGLHKRFVSRQEADKVYIDDKGNLRFDFKDFVILFRLFSMMTEINYPGVKKFITLVFEIYPNEFLIKKAPKSHKNINKILIASDLNKWIVEFDAEFSKNTNRKPHIILTNNNKKQTKTNNQPVNKNPPQKKKETEIYKKNLSKLDEYDGNSIPTISNEKLIKQVSDTSVDYDVMKGFLKKYNFI